MPNPTPQAVAKLIVKQIKTPKDLPKPVLQASVKGLRKIEMSIRQISKVTGLAKDTVQDYIDATINDDMVRYQDAIQKILMEKNDTLTILAGEAIQQKLHDTEKVPLRDVVTAYKVMHEVKNPKHNNGSMTQLVQTINVHPALGREKVDYRSIDGEVEDNK